MTETKHSPEKKMQGRERIKNFKSQVLRFKLDHILCIGGILILLIGSFGVFQRITQGLQPTSLGSYVPWGIWVAIYEYLIWLEVGSLMVFTVLIYIFKWPKNLYRMAPTLYLTALAILTMALIIIAIDLGQPLRFWYVLVWPQWGSLMAWMIWLHQIYLFILVGKLALEILPYRPFFKTASKWLSLISIPFGIALVVLAGSVFGVIMGRPSWQGSGLPVLFLISALVAGTGLLTVQYVWFMRDNSPAYLDMARRLGKLLLAFLIVNLLVTFLSAAVILYPGVPSQATALHLVLFGPYWWLFWFFQLGFGTILPLILLLTHSRTGRRIGVAGGLLVVSFFGVALNIIIPTQLALDSLERDLVSAFHGPGLTAHYFPTLNEWLITGFAFSLGFLVFIFGFNVLRLRPHAEKITEEAEV
jgi:molybdopterin-containing oxidoreductase family membrane subunit